MDINPRVPSFIPPLTTICPCIFIFSIPELVRSSTIHSTQWLKPSLPTTSSSGQEAWGWHLSTLCLRRQPPQ